MGKYLKHLKPFNLAMMGIIVLLVIQAWCDLSLPAYTSDIINVGIAQKGITELSPEAVTEKDMNQILLFLDEKDQEYVLSNYEFKDTSTLSNQELEEIAKDYKGIKEGSIYIRKNNSDMEKLGQTLRRPLATIYFYTSTQKDKEGNEFTMADMSKTYLLQQIPKENQAAIKELNFFEILAMLPKEAKIQATSQVTDVVSKMEDSLDTMAIKYEEGIYERAGIDVDGIQMNYLIIAALKMIGVSLLAMAIALAVTLIASRVGSGLSFNLRGQMFSKVVSFSNQETDRFSTASLITRCTNDIQQVQMLTVLLLRMVLYAPILGIGGVIKVINTDTQMSWIIALAVAIVLTIVAILLIVAMPKFNIMQKLVDRLNLVTREILTGLPVIRAFSAERHEEKRFDGANSDLTRNTLFTSRTMTFMFPLMSLVMYMVTLLITWFGAKGVDSGIIQTGDIFAFMQYAIMIVMSFLMMTMISIFLPRAIVAIKRIDEVLTVKNIITDTKEPKKIENVKGVLRFNHVNFAYPNADEDALQDIDFKAEPGKTTAIIGSTGCGKSTLVHLIPRLYDVTEGSITIDGMDIRDMSQHDLRELIGFVPQKGVLFSGTIDSNLRYGNQEASKELMEKAARIAQATDFIEEKEDGFESSISQGGTNVSGGQKQRLSIARAIAKEPKIYVFDDSFSALDYKTDVTLRKALKQEIGDSTVIIVAQRVSTILHAEQIIVLDDGKMAGKGTHKELLENCEVYRQIALSQLSQAEIEKDLQNSALGKEVSDHE